ELNKWIHVAMTVEPTKVTLYKDGKPWVYNGDFSNFDLSETPFEIGCPVYGQGGTFNGEMEEFRIYNKAFSQAEIREQMHLIDKNPDSSLVLYY
ncbi:MAG TPA: LamG domain-containing protein, partial [Saprospiraceae bacterium]|nr:LamG domain-containing protein [Saprospiraceae bacterium]